MQLPGSSVGKHSFPSIAFHPLQIALCPPGSITAPFTGLSQCKSLQSHPQLQLWEVQISASESLASAEAPFCLFSSLTQETQIQLRTLAGFSFTVDHLALNIRARHFITDEQRETPCLQFGVLEGLAWELARGSPSFRSDTGAPYLHPVSQLIYVSEHQFSVKWVNGLKTLIKIAGLCLICIT